MGYGTTAIVLLFAIGFCLYLGGYDSMFTTIQEQGIGSAFDMKEILVPALLTAFSVALAGSIMYAVLGGGGTLSEYALLSTFIATFLFSFLFTPIVTFNTLAMPAEIVQFLVGIFSILIIVAIIAFVRGRDF